MKVCREVGKCTPVPFTNMMTARVAYCTITILQTTGHHVWRVIIPIVSVIIVIAGGQVILGVIDDISFSYLLRLECPQQFQVGPIEGILKVGILTSTLGQFLDAVCNIPAAATIYNLIHFIVQHALFDLSTQLLGFGAASVLGMEHITLQTQEGEGDQKEKELTSRTTLG